MRPATVRTTIPAAMMNTWPPYRWKCAATASARDLKRTAVAGRPSSVSVAYTSAAGKAAAIRVARAAPLGVMAQTAILFSETVFKVPVIQFGFDLEVFRCDLQH